MTADDLPDPGDPTFLARYVESCRRLGIEPATDRMRELVCEWNALLAGVADPPVTRH
jgi:hypothetical protein